MPECRYVAVGPDDRAVAAGTVPYSGRGIYALGLGGLSAATLR